MNRWLRPTVLFATSVFFSMAVLGQEPGSISPDRPGAGNGTAIVPRGFAQIEVGFARFLDDRFIFDSHIDVLGDTLVRIGLRERIELRFAWAGYQRIHQGSLLNDFEDSGIGDAFLGARYRLRSDEGGGPAIALDAGTTVPIGDDGFTSDEFDPRVSMALDQTINDVWSFNANLGIVWQSQQGVNQDTLSDATYSLSLGFGLTSSLSGFAEYFGSEGLSSGNDGSQGVDAGLAWLPANNWQLDFSFGFDTDDTDIWFVSAGVALRLPR